MSKNGVLLINLGTPDKADPKSVHRYLKEFLSDPRVIDISAWGRWLLTNLVIVPFRYKKAAKAYQKIWGEDGSPLLVNSRNLTKKLSLELGEDYQVELSMRYGTPSIQEAFDKLKNCHRISVIPLFPQYSSAATGSAVEKLFSVLSKQWNIPELHIIRDFHDNPGFINAFSEIIKKNLEKTAIDQLIFSYHGLPERHIKKSRAQREKDDYSFCYQAQCYRTSTLLAKSLSLETSDYSVSFQSRLGRTPWIKPYTDLLLPELREKGIKNIAIVCPSFVSDCLETLEEINIRAREQWLALGGNEFIFIPCLNDHPLWIKALGNLVRSEQLVDID